MRQMAQQIACKQGSHAWCPWQLRGPSPLQKFVLAAGQRAEAQLAVPAPYARYWAPPSSAAVFSAAHLSCYPLAVHDRRAQCLWCYIAQPYPHLVNPAAWPGFSCTFSWVSEDSQQAQGKVTTCSPRQSFCTDNTSMYLCTCGPSRFPWLRVAGDA